MKKLLLFFLIISAVQTNAAIFTVISNGNAGSGSLREAISLANNNGTGSVDYIFFNLSGSSPQDVTIALESALPVLTSNIIIDATTQPFPALANPNIKIILTRITADYFSGLRIENANGVEIYGISFINFKSDPSGVVDEKKGGIFLFNVSNVIIGAPNKPNCFGNCTAGILSPFIFPRIDVQNVKISANIFGLSEDGLSNNPNNTGIDLSYLKNSIIGGNTPEEGNLIATNTSNGIALGAADGTIIIANNIIGLNKNSTLKSSPIANGIYVNGTNCIPTIVDNVIAGQFKGILVDFVNGGFTISRNRIGTGILSTENFLNATGIHINFSNTKSIIGGTNISEANYIANNKIAVLIENSYPISILKNSIYCNLDAVLFRDQPIEPAKISIITTNEVSGIYAPNSLVELFYTDECADCQGKTWFATLNTDGVGAWKYNGIVAGKITSMGTDAKGATSNFSKPEIDDKNVVKQNVFCGESNGSITNLNVYNASAYQWYNSFGVLVGTAKDLQNVGAGTYYLKAGQLGACDVLSANFTITASGNGIDDTKKNVINAICGKSNGSISNINVANNLSKTWYNSGGEIIATADDLINVSAGNYFFKAGAGACEITSSTYTIANINKNYVPKNFEIIQSSCGQQNGGVDIKDYQTDLPTKFSWLNNSGIEVSTTEGLKNVYPGIYTLMASDGNGCTNEAGRFTITEAELPVIDLTKFQSFISCDGKSVSISGAEVKGTTQPFKYQWLDKDQNQVASSLNFSALKLGAYQLVVADKYGCTINSDFLDFSELENETLKVPNSITPNGDGINDTWKIINYVNYPNADFYVFNRTGDRLFYSKGYSKEFDGTYNGKPLSVGVYYYLIDLKTDCGKLSGSLTILK